MRLLKFFALAFCLVGKPGISADHTEPPKELSPETLSVDYYDTDIRRIISDVAKAFHREVVLPKELVGKTTLRLRDVTWSQVFFSVLTPIGFDYIEGEKSIQILSQDEANRLPPESRYVEVFFQKPDELAAFLTKAFSAKMQVKTEADGIRLTCHPRHTKLMLKIIAELDTPQVRLQRFPRKVYFPETFPDLPLSDEPHDPIDRKSTWATTELIVLQWVDGWAVKDYIDRVYPKLTYAVVDQRSNALVVTGTHLAARKVLALAAYLDNKIWYQRPEKRPAPATTPPESPAAKGPAQ